MIRSSALVMSGLMAAVAAATYFGLGYLPPGLIPGVGAKPGEPLAAHSVESKDEPAATTMPAEPVADPVKAATEPAASDSPATTEVAEAPAAPVTTSKSDYASSEEIERALAAEPPPEEDAKPAAKSKPARAPVAVAEARPAPAVAPAAASAKPAEKPANPPVAETHSAPPAAASTAPAPAASNAQSADADAIKQWWPDPAKMPANQLKLVYAGQVQGQLAIALLFSDAVNLESLKQNAEVKTASGTPVSGGAWEIGKNPKLAIFRGLEAGRHTVVLGPAIAGTGGFMLGTALQGPVYVKAP